MKTLALIVAMLAGCATVPCPAGVSAPGPAPAATCATACAQGVSLGCAWATKKTTDGADCETVCENAAQTVPWDVSALTAAMVCGGPLGQ